jgi:hypothetical protein
MAKRYLPYATPEDICQEKSGPYRNFDELILPLPPRRVGGFPGLQALFDVT